MEVRDTKRFPDRDEHSLRVYAAIVGSPRPIDEHRTSWRVAHLGHHKLSIPEWANVQRLLHDATLPPQVRTKLAPLIEQAHKRWHEAVERFSSRQ